ncbi:hypothetical protein F4781DRAFT_442874 [Annulohypoxylon bovei var. microspora]|nr:hypothetical protein F4781DRAFT_442874 [Annulohypoxylon bovei var. microspora]
MTSKTALSAFCASNGVLEFAARRIAVPTQRTFSSTAQRNKNMVYFQKSSSKELDDLLHEIRHKIILPAYLPFDQRKKIYVKKYVKKLQSDPITIEIDGEVFKFRHQNPFTDVPETKRSLFRALQLFSTREDFANLRPLIEGLVYTNRKLYSDALSRIVRMIGAKGHVYDVIELARGVKRTRFKLDSSEKVNEVLHHVQLKAVESDWDPAATEKALRWAEIVLELIQEEDHQHVLPEGEFPPPGQLPLWRDPMVLLAPLHLAATLVQKQGAEADPALVDKVMSYANTIVLLWEEGKRLRQTQPEVLFELERELYYLTEPNKFTKLVAPLLYGLEAAIKVVQDRDPALAAQLQTRHDTLEAEVAPTRAVSQGKIGDAVWRWVFEGEKMIARESVPGDGEALGEESK